LRGRLAYVQQGLPCQPFKNNANLEGCVNPDLLTHPEFNVSGRSRASRLGRRVGDTTRTRTTTDMAWPGGIWASPRRAPRAVGGPPPGSRRGRSVASRLRRCAPHPPSDLTLPGWMWRRRRDVSAQSGVPWRLKSRASAPSMAHNLKVKVLFGQTLSGPEPTVTASPRGGVGSNGRRRSDP